MREGTHIFREDNLIDFLALDQFLEGQHVDVTVLGEHQIPDAMTSVSVFAQVIARTLLGTGSSSVQQRVVASQAVVPATDNHWSTSTDHWHCGSTRTSGARVAIIFDYEVVGSVHLQLWSSIFCLYCWQFLAAVNDGARRRSPGGPCHWCKISENVTARASVFSTNSPSESG